MKRPSVLAVVLVSALTMGVLAQERASFEVASVKENVSGDSRQRMVTQPGGRLIATNARLKIMIADGFLGAQPLAIDRVLGGPEWVESARYDVNAKASTDFQPSPDGPSKELLMMIRSLLEERFKLKAHLEMREMPIYELVVARADGRLGPVLRKSDVDCEAVGAAIRAGNPPPRGPLDPPPCGAMRGPARIIAGGIPMERFALMLTNILAVDARPVVDKTGLSGRFAFHMTWTPEQMPTAEPPPGVPPIDPHGPNFFTALQEQLGLKLQPAKGPVEVVVIDSIERPTPD